MSMKIMSESRLNNEEIFNLLKEKGFDGLIEIGEKPFIRAFEYFLSVEDYEKCALLRKLELMWLENRTENNKAHFNGISNTIGKNDSVYMALSLQAELFLGLDISRRSDGELLINGKTLGEFLIDESSDEQYIRSGLE